MTRMIVHLLLGPLLHLLHCSLCRRSYLCVILIYYFHLLREECFALDQIKKDARGDGAKDVVLLAGKVVNLGGAAKLPWIKNKKFLTTIEESCHKKCRTIQDSSMNPSAKVGACKQCPMHQSITACSAERLGMASTKSCSSAAKTMLVRLTIACWKRFVTQR